MDRVVVHVPASSANLGPGFDCLGLALELSADMTVSLSHEPAAAHTLAPMIVAAVRAAYRAARQAEPPEMSVSWAGDLPIARGLGASAAARAGGLVGANALMGGPLSADQLLVLGAELEGHADNMAPALFGGMQITVRGADGALRRLAVPLPQELKIALFVPDLEMPTQETRKLLPRKLAREDAVYNVGRAALLVAALSQGRWDLLDEATQDRLHQPARAKLLPALYDVFAAANSAGAHAAYLSGSGSTIAAFATEGEERIAEAMKQAAASRGFTGRTLVTRPGGEGARVVNER